MTNNNTVTKAESEIPLHIHQMFELTGQDHRDEPKSRCFYMVDSKVIFGVSLLETADSFLVGAPSRLVRKTTESPVEVERLYRKPVIRIMKSSVALMLAPEDDLNDIYLDFLTKAGVEVLPDYMTESRIAATKKVLAFRRQYKQEQEQVSSIPTRFDEGMKMPTHEGNSSVH